MENISVTFLHLHFNIIDWQYLAGLLNGRANSIYITIFISVLFLILILILTTYLLTSTRHKFHKGKKDLQFNSARMMALFAELDPDPVIRITSNGDIIETNDVTHQVFKTKNLKGRNIKDFLPFIDIDVKELLESDRTKIYTKEINNRYYSILFRYEFSLGIAQIYFRDITEQKISEDKLIESNTKLRDLSDHLQDLIEEERHRIARGLHDGIGQSLSLLRLKFLKMIENESVALKDINQTAILNSFELIIAELKDISYKLKPKTLEEMGLGIAIKLLVNQVSLDSGIKGEANIFGEEIRLDSKVEIALYRIVQEATNNILKYSNATNFSVQLLITNRIVRLIISDNGKGFNSEQILSGNGIVQGMGFRNIKERVEHLQGLLKIESSTGNGVMIVIEIQQQKKNL